MRGPSRDRFCAAAAPVPSWAAVPGYPVAGAPDNGTLRRIRSGRPYSGSMKGCSAFVRDARVRTRGRPLWKEGRLRRDFGRVQDRGAEQVCGL